jgi:phosphatidyl-myo-inositol dimannoside synthase
MLGIFPAFTTQMGGIQASGKIAWSGIVAHPTRWHTRPLLFLYGGTAGVPLNGERVVVAVNKTAAIFAALRIRGQARVIFLWHLSFLQLLPFLRLPRARTVLFLHGVEAWQPFGWTFRALLRRVDLFLSNSEYTWQRFLVDNPTCHAIPHRTVHLGIGTPFRATSELGVFSPAVLMIGRLARGEDYKGHREMITVWPAVRQRVPTAELWIVGDGDLRPDLETLVSALGSECGIRFFGRVSDEEKEQLLQRCRVMALPSRGEGFGLVYLEAMRLGRPCLVSTLDAGREVVNPPEAGLSADPRDPRALADAVCRLLTPGQAWDEWSLRARQRYEQHFTAAHFQRRLIEALC